jgi:hypothetical protein
MTIFAVMLIVWPYVLKGRHSWPLPAKERYQSLACRFAHAGDGCQAGVVLCSAVCFSIIDMSSNHSSIMRGAGHYCTLHDVSTAPAAATVCVLGEWHSGCMHGVGYFEAPDGSKYQVGTLQRS